LTGIIYFLCFVALTNLHLHDNFIIRTSAGILNVIYAQSMMQSISKCKDKTFSMIKAMSKVRKASLFIMKVIATTYEIVNQMRQ